MRKSVLVFVMLFAVACAREESRGGETPPGQPAGTPALRGTPALQGTTAGPIEFSEADLEQYERGIAKEIELVKAARQQGANASTPAERGAAAQAEWEDQTIPAAAKATGIAEDRYRSTRKAVHTVLETLDFQGKIDGPLSMDLTRANDETKARLAKDPYDALSPAAAAALRARMNSVLPLWTEYMTMTALYD